MGEKRAAAVKVEERNIREELAVMIDGLTVEEMETFIRRARDKLISQHHKESRLAHR